MDATIQGLPSPESIRERRQKIDAVNELRLLEASEDMFRFMTLVESTVGTPWYADPRWHMPQAEQLWGNTSEGDRDGGRMRPVFTSDADLSRIRGYARVLAASLDTANAIIKSLRSYTVGQGLSFTVAPKKDADETLVALVREVVREFVELNELDAERQKEHLIRAVRDGELLLRSTFGVDGNAIIREVEPEQLKDPVDAGGRPTLSDHSIRDSLGIEFGGATAWHFGIHHSRDDVQTIHGYNLLWAESREEEYVPAYQIEHWKRNVDRNVLRGVSDFYPVFDRLRRADKLILNTAVGASVQAAVPWIEEMPAGTTTESVENMVAQLKVGASSFFNRWGSQQRNQELYEAGSILRTEKGRIYKEAPGAKNSESFVAVNQALLRLVGSRWNMPEYLISGDSSNNNYASSMVAESPFVKAIEEEQGWLAARYRKLLWKVIEHSLGLGLLARSRYSINEVRAQVDLMIEGPTVQTRDPAAETLRRKMLHEARAMSRTTWQAQEELDPEVEAANFEREDAEDQARFKAMGLPPDGTPPKLAAAESEDTDENDPGATSPTKAKKERPAALEEAWGAYL